MAMKSSGSMPGKKGAIFMTTFIPQSRCDDLRVDDASVLELYGLIADSVRGASPSIARLHPLHHLAMSVFALRGCWHVWNSHLHKKQYRWNGKAGEGQMGTSAPDSCIDLLCKCCLDLQIFHPHMPQHWHRGTSGALAIWSALKNLGVEFAVSSAAEALACDGMSAYCSSSSHAASPQDGRQSGNMAVSGDMAVKSDMVVSRCVAMGGEAA